MDYIERIENATDNSIMPLICILLKDSLIAASWHNHDVNRGRPGIDIDYHQKLRKIAYEKLASFGVSKDNLQQWYDLIGARVESFGIFRDYICSHIIGGTISAESMSRLFAKDIELFNEELNRIADEYSAADCALAREYGYENCFPTFSAKDQLVPLEKKYNKRKAV